MSDFFSRIASRAAGARPARIVPRVAPLFEPAPQEAAAPLGDAGAEAPVAAPRPSPPLERRTSAPPIASITVEDEVASPAAVRAPARSPMAPLLPRSDVPPRMLSAAPAPLTRVPTPEAPLMERTHDDARPTAPAVDASPEPSSPPAPSSGRVAPPPRTDLMTALRAAARALAQPPIARPTAVSDGQDADEATPAAAPRRAPAAVLDSATPPSHDDGATGDARLAAPAARPAPPDVHIHIGRVDVRAATPPPPARRPQARLGLEDYLRGPGRTRR